MVRAHELEAQVQAGGHAGAGQYVAIVDMTILQKGFPTEELRDFVGPGVSSTLDRLEAMVRG
jgi:hypothetical protein